LPPSSLSSAVPKHLLGGDSYVDSATTTPDSLSRCSSTLHGIDPDSPPLPSSTPMCVVPDEDFHTLSSATRIPNSGTSSHRHYCYTGHTADGALAITDSVVDVCSEKDSADPDLQQQRDLEQKIQCLLMLAIQNAAHQSADRP
ncbi:hypothetical protein EV182_007316, partial [Spiromyces aspiralis]